MVLLTGNDRRIPMHFSRSMNSASTLFFKFPSKFDLVTSKFWCCDSASWSLRCKVATESWISQTSSTSRTWALSRHNSKSGRWLLASRRVCATLSGFDLSFIAFRSMSMCFSTSKISCWVLCKCNWTLLLASMTSEARRLSELFELLQQSHTLVAQALIRASESERNWADFERSDCELGGKKVWCNYYNEKIVKIYRLMLRLEWADHVIVVLTVGSYFSIPP